VTKILCFFQQIRKNTSQKFAHSTTLFLNELLATIHLDQSSVALEITTTVFQLQRNQRNYTNVKPDKIIVNTEQLKRCSGSSDTLKVLYINKESFLFKQTIWIAASFSVVLTSCCCMNEIFPK